MRRILKSCLAFDLWECFLFVPTLNTTGWNFFFVRFTWREVESPTILFGKMVDISLQKVFSLNRISSLVLPSQTQTYNNSSLRLKKLLCFSMFFFFFCLFAILICSVIFFPVEFSFYHWKIKFEFNLHLQLLPPLKFFLESYLYFWNNWADHWSFS